MTMAVVLAAVALSALFVAGASFAGEPSDRRSLARVVRWAAAIYLVVATVPTVFLSLFGVWFGAVVFACWIPVLTAFVVVALSDHHPRATFATMSCVLV